MIYIRIELWPRGAYTNPRLLHEGIIYNVGGTNSVGEYTYAFSEQGGFKQEPSRLARGEVKHVLRRGGIAGFPRLRLGAWDLLLRGLRLALGDRNDV